MQMAARLYAHQGMWQSAMKQAIANFSLCKGFSWTDGVPKGIRSAAKKYASLDIISCQLCHFCSSASAVWKLCDMLTSKYPSGINVDRSVDLLKSYDLH